MFTLFVPKNHPFLQRRQRKVKHSNFPLPLKLITGTPGICWVLPEYFWNYTIQPNQAENLPLHIPCNVKPFLVASFWQSWPPITLGFLTLLFKACATLTRSPSAVCPSLCSTSLPFHSTPFHYNVSCCRNLTGLYQLAHDKVGFVILLLKITERIKDTEDSLRAFSESEFRLLSVQSH